jgi:hypothetical protein
VEGHGSDSSRVTLLYQFDPEWIEKIQIGVRADLIPFRFETEHCLCNISVTSSPAKVTFDCYNDKIQAFVQEVHTKWESILTPALKTVTDFMVLYSIMEEKQQRKET